MNFSLWERQNRYFATVLEYVSNVMLKVYRNISTRVKRETLFKILGGGKLEKSQYIIIPQHTG